MFLAYPYLEILAAGKKYPFEHTQTLKNLNVIELTMNQSITFILRFLNSTTVWKKENASINYVSILTK